MAMWGPGYFDNDPAFDFCTHALQAENAVQLAVDYIDSYLICESKSTRECRTFIEKNNFEALRVLFERGDPVVAGLGIFSRNPMTGKTILTAKYLAFQHDSDILAGVAAAAILAAVLTRKPRYLPTLWVIANAPQSHQELAGRCITTAPAFIDAALTNQRLINGIDKKFRANWVGGLHLLKNDFFSVCGDGAFDDKALGDKHTQTVSLAEFTCASPG